MHDEYFCIDVYINEKAYRQKGLSFLDGILFLQSPISLFLFKYINDMYQTQYTMSNYETKV